MKNWPELVFNSHYLTAIEVKKSLEAGEVMDAEEGIEQLIEAMVRADRRAVKSQLVRLMKHILKWKIQPSRRSTSWIRSIHNARIEIRDTQEETPSITNDVIATLWDRAFEMALGEAEDEIGQPLGSVPPLTWDEVFEDEYLL
ncbi:DUF29 domain-containing protein [Spirosoma sp. BT702]|uniref:DUF29 domain-containing protein n=1 Tax=Spirosoma profusum TaxID=2771354 RepID=A0A926XZ13_9BACT|nr:DUF29 domain-containing protein [Spirosoma profusum]MBD2703609.1 DUF29 domain-containing protein [Spirosoma profusum]